MLNATLSLVIETTVRVEFSTWGLAPPGLIYLLAAALRLLFCGRKFGRKRYRDTPPKCSAVNQVGSTAPARLLLDTSVHKAPRDQVRAQVQVHGTAIGERQGCGPCSYCALPSLNSGFVCG